MNNQLTNIVKAIKAQTMMLEDGSAFDRARVRFVEAARLLQVAIEKLNPRAEDIEAASQEYAAAIQQFSKASNGVQKIFSSISFPDH